MRRSPLSARGALFAGGTLPQVWQAHLSLRQTGCPKRVSWSQNGQILLPIMKMIESASQVGNYVIREIGLQTIALLLVLSAEQVAGLRTQGKASGGIRWYGAQNGRMALANRKVAVKRPRLRHKTDGEVKVPAYEAIRKDMSVDQHMLSALMPGTGSQRGTVVKRG